uniref:Uncharacterized protein n=1 Tax=Solanum tuberosum TaxID=4113 RepID=M1DEI1_SOLTU
MESKGKAIESHSYDIYKKLCGKIKWNLVVRICKHYVSKQQSRQTPAKVESYGTIYNLRCINSARRSAESCPVTFLHLQKVCQEETSWKERRRNKKAFTLNMQVRNVFLQAEQEKAACARPQEQLQWRRQPEK